MTELTVSHVALVVIKWVKGIPFHWFLTALWTILIFWTCLALPGPDTQCGHPWCSRYSLLTRPLYLIFSLRLCCLASCSLTAAFRCNSSSLHCWATLSCCLMLRSCSRYTHNHINIHVSTLWLSHTHTRTHNHQKVLVGEKVVKTPLVGRSLPVYILYYVTFWWEFPHERGLWTQCMSSR